jgi:hypothetical protein
MGMGELDSSAVIGVIEVLADVKLGLCVLESSKVN